MAGADVAAGGGSSRMEVRRSPKQTMHVSAMPCEGKRSGEGVAEGQ